MRKIKFRAWETISEGMMSWKELLPHIGRIFNSPKSKNVILMQFTGLHDKNGKEIYEGDIVNMRIRENIGTFNVPDDIIANGGYTGQDDVYEGEVVYIPCAFGLRQIGDKDIEVQLVFGEDIVLEVIGNIYENPELMKEER